MGHTPLAARAGACPTGEVLCTLVHFLVHFLSTSALCPMLDFVFFEHERQITEIPATPYDAGHHLLHSMQALFSEPEPTHPPSITHDDTSLPRHPHAKWPGLPSYYFCSPCQYHNVTPAQTSFDLSFDPFHMAPFFPVPVSTLPFSFMTHSIIRSGRTPRPATCHHHAIY